MQNDRGIVLVGILLALFIVIGVPSEFALWPLWARCLTYHFMHANIFHLLANSFCLFQMARTGRMGWGRLSTAFVIASLVPIFYHGNLVGFSNILYAITGLSFWSFTRRTRRIFIIASALMLPFPQLAGVAHCISLSCGIALAFVINKLDKIGNDIKSATY